jgi:hypothetical protein
MNTKRIGICERCGEKGFVKLYLISEYPSEVGWIGNKIFCENCKNEVMNYINKKKKKMK